MNSVIRVSVVIPAESKGRVPTSNDNKLRLQLEEQNAEAIL